MRRERFERWDAESRERLLDVALHHFATHGFERASLNEIIAEAALSKGSFYYCFDDKRDLLMETLRVTFEGVRSKMPLVRVPRSRATFWAELEAHNLRLVELLAHKPLVIALLASLHRTHIADPFFEPMRAEMRAMYMPALRAGQKLGCVRDDLPLAALASIYGAADSAFDEATPIDDGPFTKARLAKHAGLAFDFFRRIVEARGGGSRRRAARKRRPT